MRVWNRKEDYDLGPSVAVLGEFDGIHAGHQELIRQAMNLAGEIRCACVVCTFDRHPLEVLCPEKAPRQLMTLEEKLKYLEKMGVDGTLVQPFNRQTASVPAMDYLQELVRCLQVKGIVAGFNFSFGAGGSGRADLLLEQQEKLGYRCRIVPPVTLDGEVVSSSAIRRYMEEGNMEKVRRFLGYEPEI